MGLNATPKGERIQIGVFGKTNAGKSSLLNQITNQDLSIVSAVKGTTTDPVYKAMEILPLGPVLLVDTPGLDDDSDLGSLRVDKAKAVLRNTDLALLVVDCRQMEDLCWERELEQVLLERKISYLWVYTHCDLVEKLPAASENSVFVSCQTGQGIENLKNQLAKLVPQEKERPLVRDLLVRQAVVVLVVPIDAAAPKGRLILPQQQVIRDVLEAGGIPIVVKDTELPYIFSGNFPRPDVVITDSQVFEQVARIVPQDVPMTSFSILMARYKGNLERLARNVEVLDTLQDGDCILMAEGCTHHRQCGDIGTVKLPNWIRQHTKKKIQFDTTSGTGFPAELSPYRMVIHCGGCMLQKKEMQYRMKLAQEQGVPMVNYGIAIAYLKGILQRSMSWVAKQEGKAYTDTYDSKR